MSLTHAFRGCAYQVWRADTSKAIWREPPDRCINKLRPEGPAHRVLCRPFRPQILFLRKGPVTFATGWRYIGPSALSKSRKFKSFASRWDCSYTVVACRTRLTNEANTCPTKGRRRSRKVIPNCLVEVALLGWLDPRPMGYWLRMCSQNDPHSQSSVRAVSKNV